MLSVREAGALGGPFPNALHQVVYYPEQVREATSCEMRPSNSRGYNSDKLQFDCIPGAGQHSSSGKVLECQ